MEIQKIEKQSTNLIDVESARAAKEIEIRIACAKKFPRDETTAIQKITKACQRRSLAEKAMYSYPRGGTMVTGPSIRLAETIANSWGNLSFGIKEISNSNGESIVQAYCHDLETNVDQTKIFTVKHERHTKKGIQKLTDSRDIYELVANNGARRLRSCILSIIPVDVVEDAIKECEDTLARPDNKLTRDEVINRLLKEFANLGVSREMIQKKYDRDIKDLNNDHLVELRKIFLSIKDDYSSIDQWFSVEKISEKKEVKKIEDVIKN